MMPMVFCASLAPWPSEYSEAETNCRARKVLSALIGATLRKLQETISTSSSASAQPLAGDMKIATKVLPSPHQTIEEKPALASPAPTRPPISACEELDGMPAIQ